MQPAAPCSLHRAVAHLSRRVAPGGMGVCRMQAVGHAVMDLDGPPSLHVVSARAKRDKRLRYTGRQLAGVTGHPVTQWSLHLGCPGKRSCGDLYGLGGRLPSQDRPSLARCGKYDRRAPELSGTSLVFAVLHAPVSARRARSRSRQFDVVVAANSTLRRGVGSWCEHASRTQPERLPVVWRVVISWGVSR